MRLLDRFLNPAWHRVGALPEQAQFEIAVLVTLHGGVRHILREQLIDPLEKLLDPKAPQSIREGSFGELLDEGRHLSPLKPSLRERLIDEAELAFFRCVQGQGIGKMTFSVMNASTIVEGAGAIALAEIKARTGQSLPDVLDSVRYSRDPDECRVQLAIELTSEMALKNPQWPSFLAQILEGPWGVACAQGLQGMATGFARVPREVLLNKAREECGGLSQQGRKMVEYLAESIARRKTPTTGSKEPLLQVRSIVDTLVKDLARRGHKSASLMSDPIARDIVLSACIPMALAAVYMRHSGQDRDYAQSSDWRSLTNAGVQWMARCHVEASTAMTRALNELMSGVLKGKSGEPDVTVSAGHDYEKSELRARESLRGVMACVTGRDDLKSYPEALQGLAKWAAEQLHIPLGEAADVLKSLES